MFSIRQNFTQRSSRLPKKSQLLTMDTIYKAQPFVEVVAKNQNTLGLDVIYNAQPFIAASNNRLTSTYSSLPTNYNPDLEVWLLNGGTASAGTLSAMNTFCNSIDSAGLRNKFYRLNLFCGSNLNSCIIPIYTALSTNNIQFGYPSDLNFNFTNSDYVETSGLRSATTTGYLDTGVIASTLSVNNLHFGIGLLATDTSGGVVNRTLIGLQDGVNNDTLTLDIGSSSNCGLAIFGLFNDCTYRFGDNGSSSNPVRLSTGNIIASWPNMYRNGVVTGGTATNYKNHISSNAKTIYVFGSNLQGSISRRTDARLGWYSIGTSMNSSQISQFNTIINTFYSSISRT